MSAERVRTSGRPLFLSFEEKRAPDKMPREKAKIPYDSSSNIVVTRSNGHGSVSNSP